MLDRQSNVRGSLTTTSVAPISNIEISVVIPLWNERETLEEMVERVGAVLRKMGRPYEIIFVDDGSTDGTFDVLHRLQAGDSHIRAARLRRNYGQHAALSAGLELSRGRYVITMDGDLQNPPEEIPGFIEKLDEGFDVVSGWRQHRQIPLFSRRIPSRILNWMVGRVTGVRLHDYGCGFNGMTDGVAKAIAQHGAMRKFLAALMVSEARSVCEVKVNDCRREGKGSNYSFFRLLGLTLDFITSFSVRPFQIIGILGFGFLMASILGVIGYILGRIFFILSPSAVIQILTVLSFFMGLQLIVVGLLGEYNIRIYRAVQGQPLYIIETLLEGERKYP
ncbi:MAG: glycosyltransferase family 2 protein [Deltaproteobacteria bacterium]|nr:glycosyltransferase family 2 protein [Deltaproteobacteria bacterium]